MANTTTSTKPRPPVDCTRCGAAPELCDTRQQLAIDNAPADATDEQRNRRGWYARCCANCQHIV